MSEGWRGPYLTWKKPVLVLLLLVRHLTPLDVISVLLELSRMKKKGSLDAAKHLDYVKCVLQVYGNSFKNVAATLTYKTESSGHSARHVSPFFVRCQPIDIIWQWKTICLRFRRKYRAWWRMWRSQFRLLGFAVLFIQPLKSQKHALEFSLHYKTSNRRRGNINKNTQDEIWYHALYGHEGRPQCYTPGKATWTQIRYKTDAE